MDPTKTGFRLSLREDFVKEHLNPRLLPTLYLTALPLRPGEDAVQRVFYPDALDPAAGGQVALDGLQERAWHALCLEWENFNRQNETTGTDCRLARTLDRLGRASDSTLEDISAADVAAQMFTFRLRSAADFPIRLTASLQGGDAPAPPAQVFQLDRPADLEVVFPFLRQASGYGRLCVLEEPLATGFTALGRPVTGLSIQRCYFSECT